MVNSCELSAGQTFLIKCQALFSQKSIMKTFRGCHLLQFCPAKGLQSVESFWRLRRICFGRHFLLK